MKSITRYASLLSACSLLAGSVLLADNTNSTGTSTGASSTNSSDNSSTMNSSDTTSTGGAATPRSDNTMGTSGSTNNTSPSTTNSMNNGSAMNNSSTMNNSSVGATGVNDPLSMSLTSADYANRSQVAADVEQRLDSQKETLKSLKKEGHQLTGQSKSDFKAAWDDVEAREKDLKHSLHQARNSSQDRWDASRSQLATNYQAFETSVSRLQTQLGANMSTTGSNNMMSK